jgi:hypothetical protein
MSLRRLLGSVVLALSASSVFVAIFVHAQDAPPTQATPDDGKKKKKGPGTPVVNAVELPVEMTPGMMEVFRISLGVECSYCHVSGDFLERGHNGDRQSDSNPRKLIARDMIKMTKEINRAITGNGNFPDSSNVVTCWTCHRGNRRPPTSAATTAVSSTGQPAPAAN